MTFNLEIPDDEFQSFIEEMVLTYHRYSLSDLGLTPKDMDSLMKEAKSRLRGAIQDKVNAWYDEVEHETFAYSLLNHAALDKAVQALHQKEETEEEKRCLEERIKSAAKFLQKHGYKVTQKG